MSNQTIRTKADILEFFKNSAVPDHELMIGIEVERSAVCDKTLKPVQYLGDGGYLAILKKLVEEVGWKIIKQDDAGNIKEISRGGSAIHVENDGRLELVSKPRKGLYSLCRECEMHTREIDEISKEFGVRWISLGRQPFATTDEIISAFPDENTQFINHYEQSYTKQKKDLLLGWQKKDNGIHINFGYTSEQDAINKFQTLLKITPILVSMFANSPLELGKISPYLNTRFRSSLLSCPESNKMQPNFLNTDFSFEKWVDFMLKIPMRLISRNGVKVFVPLLFKDFLKDGFEDFTATTADMHSHIRSELRIKQYIEYRNIDTVPPHLIPSVLAIIRAITLNDEVMMACQALVKDWTFTDQLEMRDRVCKDALQARTPDGKKVLDLAKELLNITSVALQDRHATLNRTVDASRFLWPIKEYILVREQSPAEFVMEQWNGDWHKDPRKLIEWSER